MTTARMLTTLLLLAVTLAACGCTHNQTRITPEGNIDLVTSPANVTQLTPDGRLMATQHGIGTTAAHMDELGIDFATPGTSAMAVYDPSSGKLYLSAQSDTAVEGFEAVRGEDGTHTVRIARLMMNVSAPLAQHVAAFIQAAQSLEGLTATEAEARVEQMRLAGEITADVANLLLQVVVPLLVE